MKKNTTVTSNKQLKGTLADFNATCPEELRIKIVTFDQFRKLHKNMTSNKATFDNVVANIKEVKIIDGGYNVLFENGKKYSVWYNGQTKNGRGHKKAYNDNGRTRDVHIGGYNINSSVFPERMIGICSAILNDELPETIDNMTINVMDGSGNIFTAMDLGVLPNLHEENLEWTTSEQNFIHGGHIKLLFKHTGHVYRFSANDDYLSKALSLGKTKEIIDHCETHCELVK